MKEKQKPKKEKGEAVESLEEIIEKRKTVADAYRKILASLESKPKKSNK